MGWKTTETPLNLIHILPSDGEKSKPKLPYDPAQSLRIQVGDEAPSAGVQLFATMLDAVRGAGKQLLGWIQAGFALCGRGCRCVGNGLASVVTGVIRLGKNGVGASINLLVRLAQNARERSDNISEKIWKIYSQKKNATSKSQSRIVPATIESQPVSSMATLEHDELLGEVHALRDQLTAQRKEFTRVNSQISELKALAVSQQQVLLHLGKELESIESKTGRPEKAVTKKVKPRSSKSAKAKPFPSSVQSPRESALRVESPR
ncbi:MAG: hypothetical protein NPIRA02_22680 [Nitrospirales bacterium]|nr:MAG: hypothetical protein NPIRA02_22680 [Nitrospirales bacterium]